MFFKLSSRNSKEFVKSCAGMTQTRKYNSKIVIAVAIINTITVGSLKYLKKRWILDDIEYF